MDFAQRSQIVLLQRQHLSSRNEQTHINLRVPIRAFIRKKFDWKWPSILEPRIAGIQIGFIRKVSGAIKRQQGIASSDVSPLSIDKENVLSRKVGPTQRIVTPRVEHFAGFDLIFYTPFVRFADARSNQSDNA